MTTEEMIQWGTNYLTSHGYILKNNLAEPVQHTPWSWVVRFATTDGYIYLKHTPKALALEPRIIKILRDQFYMSVPEIIAQNNKLNSFLMKDAGTLLREILKTKFDVGLFCKAITQFTLMQFTLANHINTFLDIGVPDWRLDKFSDLYSELLAKKTILLEDGLSEEEIIELNKLLPTVYHLCQKLSSYSIQPSIVQPDFNDNNTLIDLSGKLTTIDLGEIVISHPFFSLINCLYQAKKHYSLSDKDDTYLKLREAGLKNYYSQNESKTHVLDAFAIAEILWLIYAALANDRLKTACEKSKFTSVFKRHGRVSIPLKEFLAQVHRRINRIN